MSFLKKLFNINTPKDEELHEQEVNLSLDDAFVHHFLTKGGKFLYCTTPQEVSNQLNNILEENQWDKLICRTPALDAFIDHSKIELTSDLKEPFPFFTNCEHLISDNGDILFSSNQLQSQKLASITDNFIVYATTSQLVKNTGEGLTGIKTNCKDAIPTNISAVKAYTLSQKDDDSFLNYGNSNSKNLYLLLFEDL